MNGTKKQSFKWNLYVQLFHDGGPYNIETSPLIFSANHHSFSVNINENGTFTLKNQYN